MTLWQQSSLKYTSVFSFRYFASNPRPGTVSVWPWAPKMSAPKPPYRLVHRWDKTRMTFEDDECRASRTHMLVRRRGGKTFQANAPAPLGWTCRHSKISTMWSLHESTYSLSWVKVFNIVVDGIVETVECRYDIDTGLSASGWFAPHPRPATLFLVPRRLLSPWSGAALEICGWGSKVRGSRGEAPVWGTKFPRSWSTFWKIGINFYQK